MPTAWLEHESPPSFSGSADPSMPWYRTRAGATALVALATVVAALLRLHGLTAKSFWGDEAYSVEIARLPWRSFGRLLWYREGNMSLYYLLLRFWLRLGGAEGMIRGFSALAGVATVPLMYSLGRRLFGHSTGLLAAWLLAINAYHVRYAQGARSYALVAFLSVLATWLLVRNLQEASSAHWGAYAAVCVLIVYSHFFGALVVLAHMASLLFLRRGQVPWRKVVRALLWFVYLMIPIAYFVSKTGTGPIDWIPSLSTGEVWHFFVSLAGNFGAPLLILDAAALAVAGVAGRRIWRREAGSMQSWGFTLVFLWLFLPILLVLSVSVVKPFFVGRYLIPCLPALILIVAAGIARLRPAILATVLCAAISVCALAGVNSYYHRDFDLHRRDWRSVASVIFNRAQPDDGIVFYGGSGHILFEFYRQQRHPSPAWPKVLTSESGTGITYRDFIYRDLKLMLAQSLPAGNRVWLVLADDGIPNPVTKRLRQVYGKGRSLVAAQTISGITILLYARNGGASGAAHDSGYKAPGPFHSK